MTDPFFEIIPDAHWNACVGVQGSEINYVEGYLDAATLLADMLIEQKLTSKRDTLLMPILYNARHGLELALKYAVTELAAMDLIQRPDGRANHHILRYWRHLSEADVADRVVREIVAALEPFAVSLSRMDADGQQLRYFSTADDRRSLGEQSVVHLPLIRESVTKLSTILGKLTERLSDMQAQQGTGTRTTRCSRLDLAEIVSMLGSHRAWSEESFLERKAKVMERFCLTKKAFSNAIDAIRNSRELAARLGIETELTYLADETAVWLTEQWLDFQSSYQSDGTDILVRASQISLKEIENYSAAENKLVTAIIDRLSPEQCADLETIFYIGRNRDHGEYYDGYLEDTVRKYVSDANRRWEYVDHVVSKTSLLDGLISGLRRVGRPTLAEQLSDILIQTKFVKTEPKS